MFHGPPVADRTQTDQGCSSKCISVFFWTWFAKNFNFTHAILPRPLIAFQEERHICVESRDSYISRVDSSTHLIDRLPRSPRFSRLGAIPKIFHDLGAIPKKGFFGSSQTLWSNGFLWIKCRGYKDMVNWSSYCGIESNPPTWPQVPRYAFL